MYTLSQEGLTLCAEGPRLWLEDSRRGQRWTLDPASAVWGGADAVEGAGPLRRMTFESAGQRADCLYQSFRAGEAEVCLEYRLSQGAMTATLTPIKGRAVECVSLPGAFHGQADAEKLLLPIMQGMLWQGGGAPCDKRVTSRHHDGFSMAMAAVLGERGGLLMAADEGLADAAWRYGKQAGELEAPFVCPMALASLGGFSSARTVRFIPVEPTVAAAARAYRAFVMERGRFASWQEKMKARPELEGLFGALMCFIGYCQDDVDYAGQLAQVKAMGFDRALVYPVGFNMAYDQFLMGGRPPIALSGREKDAIRALGYRLAPWSWINESMDDGLEATRGGYYAGRDGQRRMQWQIDDFKWYLNCAGRMLELERQAVEGRWADMDWDHFDVVACAMLGECYALDHAAHPGRPMSRQEDLALLRRLLVMGSRGRGPVSSEGFNDLFSMEYDMGSVKALPQYGRWPFWPVPLTALVYHDSIMHTWWEVHNYNNPHFFREGEPAGYYQYGGGRPRLMAAMDALMGAPPDVMPCGAQYAWTGRGSETCLFTMRVEDEAVQEALKAALPVARLHRRIGPLAMTDFSFLSGDGCLQQTVFADGTQVTANFDGIGRTLPDGTTLEAESWRAVDREGKDIIA